MSKFGQQLGKSAAQRFAAFLAEHDTVERIREVSAGTSFTSAEELAEYIGKHLGKIFDQETATLAFLDEATALELIAEALTRDHEVMAQVASQVAQNLNAAAGIGIKAAPVELDPERISGLASKLASYESLEEGRWLFGEPVVNFSQHTVDEAVRSNARAVSKAGAVAYIVRKAEAPAVKTTKRGKRIVRYSVPCKWCQRLEGRYLYEDVKDTGNDVYRRHDGCRCEVTYELGSRRQDVYSKASWTAADADRQAAMIEAAIARKEAEAKARETRQEG
jgi:hypothetical protein